MGELLSDVPIWLYIIFGIIYLISRLRKKPAEQTDFPEYGPENPAPNPGKDQPRRVDQELPKQMTFEELLREISQGKVEKESEKKVVPPPVYESYEDVIAEEEQDLELDPQEYRQDKVRQIYEEGKRQAFVRPSLEETLDIKDTDTTFGRFKEFEREPQRNLISHYLRELHDPEGLKKAVVMSEILKRKF